MRTVDELYSYAKQHNYIEGDYSEEKYHLFEKIAKAIPINDEAIAAFITMNDKNEFLAHAVCFRQIFIVDAKTEEAAYGYHTSSPKKLREVFLKSLKSHFTDKDDDEEELFDIDEDDDEEYNWENDEDYLNFELPDE